MGTEEMNLRASKVMGQWDPFTIGSDKYSEEITGVLTQLKLLDDPSSLAKEIQSIYQISYGIWIPLEKCVAVSYKLLALKFEAKSII